MSSLWLIAGIGMETSAPQQSDQASSRDRFFERYRDDEDEYGFDVKAYGALGSLYPFLLRKMVFGKAHRS